jgi:hypothetical protein
MHEKEAPKRREKKKRASCGARRTTVPPVEQLAAMQHGCPHRIREKKIPYLGSRSPLLKNFWKIHRTPAIVIIICNYLEFLAIPKKIFENLGEISPMLPNVMKIQQFPGES